MAKLVGLIDQLKTTQQQAVVEILLKVQESKPITEKDVGLLGYSIERFPVSEFFRLFDAKSGIGKIAKKIIASHCIQPIETVNLKAFLSPIIEEELDRRLVFELTPRQRLMIDPEDQ